MSALSMFQSNLREALKILARGSFASTAERDEILRALVEGASKLRARDVVWMLFKPDRAIRTAGATILRQHASPDILEAFLSQARGKPEAAIRAASGLLFQLEIPDLSRRLAELAMSPDEETRNMARTLAFSAPDSPAMEAFFWHLTETGNFEDRLNCLTRLAEYPVTARNLGRWQKLARSSEGRIREQALLVVADAASRN